MNAGQANWLEAMLGDSLRRLLKEGKSWMLDDAALDVVVAALLAHVKALHLPHQETRHRSPEEAHAWLQQQGITIAQWSRDNGFNETLVHEVLTGRRPCKRGQSHNIAVALDMKAGIPTTRPARVPPSKRHAVSAVAAQGVAA